MDLLRQIKQTVAKAAAKHVFRSYAVRKRKDIIPGLDVEVYYSSLEFSAAIHAAAQIVERDKRATESVHKYVSAVVEVEDFAALERLGNSGMLIGVHYDQLAEHISPEVAAISLACALVQFAACRKLLAVLNVRCPQRRNQKVLRKIMRMSIEKMYGFMLNVGLDGRISYEIECKLKNGAWGC